LTKDIVVKGKSVKYSLSADITSTGFLNVIMPVERVSPENQILNEILTLSRHLDGAQTSVDKSIPVLPVATLSSTGDVAAVPLSITPTPDYSILYDNNVSTSPSERNLIGAALIGLGLIVTVFLLIWRRPTKKQQ
jgi:hypothetical protein